MNILELKNALDKITVQANDIFVKTGYAKLGELASVDFDPKDPNQAFLYEEFYSIVRKLDHVAMQMDYINRPIKCEGYLSLNERDRYELCGIELTCGAELEVLVYDDFYERNVWYPSVIERNSYGYYFVAKPELDLDGMRARLRQ